MQFAETFLLDVPFVEVVSAGKACHERVRLVMPFVDTWDDTTGAVDLILATILHRRQIADTAALTMSTLS